MLITIWCEGKDYHTAVLPDEGFDSICITSLIQCHCFVSFEFISFLLCGAKELLYYWIFFFKRIYNHFLSSMFTWILTGENRHCVQFILSHYSLCNLRAVCRQQHEKQGTPWAKWLRKFTYCAPIFSHIIQQMKHYVLTKAISFGPRPQRMQLSVHCSSSLSSWIWWRSRINSCLRAN